MAYHVEEKNIPPLLVLSHKADVGFSALENTSFDLLNLARKNINTNVSFFCTTEQAFLKQDSQVRVCAPVLNAIFNIDENKYHFFVRQRQNVVSTIHNGRYDQIEPAFQALQDYLAEKNLQPQLPYYIIFHKEKRKWQRKTFFKKSTGEYVTEIQIPYQEKTDA